MGKKDRNFVARAEEYTKKVDEKTPAAGVQHKEVAPSEPVVNKIEEPKEYDGIVEGVEMYLNIRENPNLSATIITMIKNGTQLKVVDKNEGSEFYKVKSKEPAFEGYAMKKYVKLV